MRRVFSDANTLLIKSQWLRERSGGVVPREKKKKVSVLTGRTGGSFWNLSHPTLSFLSVLGEVSGAQVAPTSS